MTDVLIKRELLERIDETAICDGTDATISDDLFMQLVAALAAPRQPEGDGLEVVESLHVWRATNRFGDTCHFGDAGCARIWAGNGGKVDRIELKPVPELYDVNHSDAAEVSATEIKVVAWAHCADATRLLCDLGKQRSVPGHYADEFTIPLCRLSDHQRAIAELRAECERLRGECARLESKYERDVWGLNNEGDPIGGDPAGGFANDLFRVTTERDTLRQQLAERDAQIASMRAEVTPFIETHWMPVARQRDKLAGLLERIANHHIDGNIRPTVRDCVNGRPDVQDIYGYCDEIEAEICAALAEVER